MITLHFSHPQYLLLLPLAWAFTWWVQRTSLADLGRGRGVIAMVTRMVLLSLLILALAGIQLVRPTAKLCTVFVVDVSDSIVPTQRQIVLDYIHQATKGMRHDDSAALVAFGAEALLDHAQDDTSPIRKIVSLPGTSRTDIAAGIQLAMASFPQDAGKQIVLFSDGNENLGDALAQAGLAHTNDVHISVVPLARDTSRGEVLLLHAQSPAEVKQGEPFQVAVVAESLQDTDAHITLFRNNEQVAGPRLVHLHPGKTVVSFEQSVPKSGLNNYRAFLEVPAGHDTVPDNNVAYSYTRVSGKPKVLIVEGTPGDGKYLAHAMQAQDLDVVLGGPERIPQTLAESAQYESLVLANVPAWKMSPTQMAVIHSAVRDTGMGFCMVGGEESFGAGGYYHTPVEAALPVSLDIKKKKSYPAVAIALIIEDLEVQSIVNTSIEAAKSTVDLLSPIDYVGVLGCAGSGSWSRSGINNTGSFSDWRIPMTQVTNKAALKNQMDQLSGLGDPPSYEPYLAEAARVLKNTPARVKHIVLVGDGDAEFEFGGGSGGNKNKLTATLNQLVAEGVTVSTIATGIDGPEASKFMNAIAVLGHGQSYTANKPEDLPRYLTRDEQTISKPPIVEEPFRVVLNDNTHPIMQNVPWESTPPLLGYVLTSEKEGAPTARLLLSSPKDDPVLAAWPFGLGRSVAFTSDATAHWGAHWLGWGNYASFWAQTLRWTLRRAGKADFETTVMENHGRATISVEAIGKGGEFRNLLNLRAHLAYVNPDTPEDTPLTAEDILPLSQTAPGRYEANFEARKIGTYIVTVEEQGEGDNKKMQMATLVVPYSPEFQTLTPNGALLSEVADETNGQKDPAAEDIFGRLRFQSRLLRDIWPALIAILAVLFLLDVGMRRILLPWNEFFAIIRQAIMGRLPSWNTPAPAAAGPETATLGSLLNTKTKVRHQPGAPIAAPTLLTTGEQPADPAAPETQAPEPPPAPAGPTHVTGTLLAKKRERKGK